MEKVKFIYILIVAGMLFSCSNSGMQAEVKNMEIENEIDVNSSSLDIKKSLVSEEDSMIDDFNIEIVIENEENNIVYNKLLYTHATYSHKSNLEMRIELFGNDDKVEIIKVTDNITGQDINILQTEYSKGKITDSYGFYIDDYNFDNYEDLRLQGMGGAGANTRFTYWFWDTDKRCFVLNEELSGLTQTSFDYENEFVISINSCCAGASYQESVYTFTSNGQLVLYKSLSREWNVDKEIFEFDVYEMIGTDSIHLYHHEEEVDGENYPASEMFWGEERWYLQTFE